MAPRPPVHPHRSTTVPRSHDPALIFSASTEQPSPASRNGCSASSSRASFLEQELDLLPATSCPTSRSPLRPASSSRPWRHHRSSPLPGIAVFRRSLRPRPGSALSPPTCASCAGTDKTPAPWPSPPLPERLQDLVCPAASPNPATRTLQRRRFLPPVARSTVSRTRRRAPRLRVDRVPSLVRSSSAPPDPLQGPASLLQAPRSSGLQAQRAPRRFAPVDERVGQRPWPIFPRGLPGLLHRPGPSPWVRTPPSAPVLCSPVD
ncbi:vegetative cell wall protein gp1-like isoform X1 [Triticum dicoccoides]|uniref:vegetative cell wall protein gp1-like isoform X1 n=1 Tax=Triticum dicoccoides TaxID=85692 RepID=UPI00188DE56F|nr:vegetative cell wall protein gp1-like isoform X1 [Triticum dicoccoides]